MSRNVLKKYQRDIALCTQFDEMSRFQSAFGEEHTVVSDNAYRISPDAREPTDDRRCIKRFELVEPTRVDDTINDFANVIALFRIARDETINFIGIVARLFRLRHRLH